MTTAMATIRPAMAPAMAPATTASLTAELYALPEPRRGLGLGALHGERSRREDEAGDANGRGHEARDRALHRLGDGGLRIARKREARQGGRVDAHRDFAAVDERRRDHLELRRPEEDFRVGDEADLVALHPHHRIAHGDSADGLREPARCC